MKVIGKDRTSCDVCNPIDEILARLDALERRASAIVAKVQGLAPDGEGNVTLPTSSSDTDPLHGRVDAFAMSSEVKEAADDAHAYAASIADDVVVLQSDVEILTREVEALDPASVAALEQSVAALQRSVNQLSNTVAGCSAVIADLEDQMPNKVDRTGDTMTGPLNVIDTVTGSRNAQAVNGNRLQNDLDNYAMMLRTTGNQTSTGIKQGSWSMYRMRNPDATNDNKWLRYCSMDTNYAITMMRFVGRRGNNGYAYCEAIVSGVNPYTRVYPIINVPASNVFQIQCSINSDTGKMEIWIHYNNVTNLREMTVEIDSPDLRNVVYLMEEHDDLPTSGYNIFVKILG